MRKMQNLENPNHVVTVYEHLILKNFWEYYVLDENRHEEIRYCLVMGFE